MLAIYVVSFAEPICGQNLGENWYKDGLARLCLIGEPGNPLARAGFTVGTASLTGPAPWSEALSDPR